MQVLLIAHLITGVALVALGDRLGRRAFAVAGLPVLATLVWAIGRAPGILDGRPVEERVGWVPELGLRLDVRVDGFSLLMVLLVSGIGVLICAYALAYFSHPPEGVGRLAGLLCLFAGAMTGLVSADQVAMLLLCWEATSITSYLLIGNQDRDPRARAAALQALLITGAGGLVLLLGLVLLADAAGTSRLSGILEAAPSGGVVTAGLVCVLVGAFTKSAQHPFGSWLPGAMVAPTPVSAYLHSATMVKAGVYLVGRFAPAFAGNGPWRALCVSVGLTTMVIGGYRALRQTDLKLLLAMTTVSQLGLLVAMFGLGFGGVTQAAVVMLVAHALYKSALFMVVGIIDHETGTRDVRLMDLQGTRWRAVRMATLASAASMAGLPLVLGFVSKEKLLDGLLHVRHDMLGGAVVFGVVGLGAALGVAAAGRFVLGVYGQLREAVPVETEDGHHHHGHDGSLASFVAPAAVLSSVTVVAGVFPSLLDRVQKAATVALVPGKTPKGLNLWHGVNAALVWSAVIVATGVLLVVGRRQVEALQRVRIPHLSAERGYLVALRGVNTAADRVTRVVQSGSLPVYIGVILLVAATGPMVALVAGDGWPDRPRWVDLPVHLPITAVLVGAAVCTAVLRRRFAAALALGAVGYAMAGLYISYGAPDLALTQFAIETLSVVLFVLVLRFLPDEPKVRHPLPARVARIVVAGAVAVFVFVLALASRGARTGPSVSDEYIARSVPEGKGGNVVNVTIVDFRGMDTLGEITVLVVAAVGAVGLTRLGRRSRRDATEVDG